jgi:hypothetical protein
MSKSLVLSLLKNTSEARLSAVQQNSAEMQFNNCTDMHAHSDCDSARGPSRSPGVPGKVPTPPRPPAPVVEAQTDKNSQ